MLNLNLVSLLFLTFSVWFSCSQAQDNRILYTSDQINQSEQVTPRIISVADRPITNFLTVKYEDGSKKRIKNKDVWGYIADGKLYRRYKRDFFEVLSQGDLIKYQSRPIPNYNSITKSTTMIDRPYLFSKTLDGKLYSSAKAAQEGD